MKLLILILILGYHNVGAQEDYVYVSGSVYDSISGFPIESAHVYFQDKPLGTVTSRLGFFELNIPLYYLNQQLTISSMGYRSAKLAISSSQHKLILLLSPVSTLLNEIMIRDKIDSGRIILKKAINAIEENYPRKKHSIEGFYRELSIRDTTYTRLIEAAIIVQENGYNRKAYDKETLDVKKSRVQIIELRKSDDGRTYDNMGFALNVIFGEKNDLYEILEDNYIRFLGMKSPHFLSDNFLKDYDISLKGVTEMNGQIVYIVSLTSSPDLFFIREVDFYINQMDNAFLRIENSSLINSKNEEMLRSAIDRRYLYHSDISYRKIGSKYIPYTINTQKYASNTNPLRNTSNGRELQYMDLTFLLTNYEEDSFDRITKRDAESTDTDINKIEWTYNDLFWDRYNMIILHPLSQRAVSNLEKNKKLNDQFKKN